LASPIGNLFSRFPLANCGCKNTTFFNTANN
jgi:hypothetical protein